VKWIRLGRVDREEGEEDADKDEGSDPRVLQSISPPLLKEGLCFSSL
jgi:hypothetical protein